MRIVFILLGSFLFTTNAYSLPTKLERNYLKTGGSRKALSHLNCFLNNYANKDFKLKPANMADRCTNMAEASHRININNDRYIVVVDYTKKSFHRRFFILDTKRQSVDSLYVSHGRFKADYGNKTLAKDQNSIEDILYYSNIYGSNTSSSGFYITGQVYQGRWVGPDKDKFSLIIHGISKEINDNACDRAIVVHGNKMIRESGPDEGVKLMSSGCFMLDYDVVNEVLSRIRGGGGKHYPDEARLGGVLFFTYGKREARLPSNYYCTSKSTDSLRIY